MGWRDNYNVHPAADVFPMMSDDELAKLGENFKANGLFQPIKLMYVSKAVPIDGTSGSFSQRTILIDGRNRLEAMERAGIDLESCALKWQSVNGSRGPFNFDAVSYIISANIHRRHLTKVADLIVAAIKAGAEASRQAGEVPKRHVKGKAGSEKDEVKARAVAAAEEQGISKRTVERAIAKSGGKAPKPKLEREAPTIRRAWLDMASEAKAMAESILAGAANADPSEIDKEVLGRVEQAQDAWEEARCALVEHKHAERARKRRRRKRAKTDDEAVA